MINHIEEAYQENTLEEANSKGKLIAWIFIPPKSHKVYYIGSRVFFQEPFSAKGQLRQRGPQKVI